MLRNNVRVMRQEEARLRRTAAQLDAKIRDNQEKLKLNKTLPYLVANVVEVLDVEAEDGADTTTGGGQAGNKAAVVRTSNRQVRSNCARSAGPGAGEGWLAHRTLAPAPRLALALAVLPRAPRRCTCLCLA